MSDWTCPNCRERIEANFETCWKCGTSPTGAPPPDPSIYTQIDESFNQFDAARYHALFGDYAPGSAAVARFRPRDEDRIQDDGSSSVLAYEGPPCVCCGRTEFSFGAINSKFYEAGSVMFSHAMDIRARRCLSCGNLQLFTG